jgi:hypothetical protein
MRTIIYIALVALSLMVGTLQNTSFQKINNFANFNETAEYRLARRLQGKYFGNCKTFKDFWLTVFPQAKCEKVFLIPKTPHWRCHITDDLWADANSDWQGVVKIWRKK